MARSAGKHTALPQGDDEDGLIPDEETVLVEPTPELPPVDPAHERRFEAEFFGRAEANAPEATHMMVQSARYRVIHENPEDRPFARGNVLQKIEAGDKDAYVSARTVNSRKGLRRLQRILIAVAVLILVGGIVLYVFLSDANYRSAESTFNESVSLMQGTDDVVVNVDSAVNSQVTADRLAKLDELMGSVPATEESLQQVIASMDSIEPAMKRHSNGDIVQQMRTSAEARLSMLESGAQLIDYDRQAMRSSESFAESWTLILQADSKAREAAAFVAYATTANMTQALSLNSQALEQLTSARGKLDDAANAFPEADFTLLYDYIDAKAAAIGYAQAAEQAYLDGDTAKVEEQTALYDTADATAVQAAAALPSNPDQLILNAYDQLTASPRKAYVEARQQASEADAVLRNYLGINEVITDTPATQELVTEVSADTATEGAAA